MKSRKYTSPTESVESACSLMASYSKTPKDREKLKETVFHMQELRLAVVLKIPKFSIW